jgi:hypothetical protein
VRQVLKDPLALRVFRDLLVQFQMLQVRLDLQVLLALKVLLAPKVLKATKVSLDLQVQLVLIHSFQVLKDLQVLVDKLVPQDLRALLPMSQVLQAPQDQ